VFFLNHVFEFPLSRNAKKRNKKKRQGDFFRRTTRGGFVIAFLTSPCREALDQRNKNKSKERKRSKKSTREKKSPPKNVSPVDFLETYSIFFSVFSNPLCGETPEYALKRRRRRMTYVRTFFGELAQMYVGLSLFIFCRPSGQDRDREMRGSQALGFEVCLGLSLRLLASGFLLKLLQAPINRTQPPF
jgi:hypothetical protein